MYTKGSFPIKLLVMSMVSAVLIGSCTNVLGFNRRVSGSGSVVQENRTLHSFTEVVLSEEGDLFIDVGDREQLIVEAEDNLQEYLVAEVNMGILEIKKLPENVTLNATQPIRYYLTVKELKSLTIKNSGDAEVSEVRADKFLVHVKSSGSVHIGKLDVQRLDVELTSSGDLVIDEGEADEQFIRLSSSGEYIGKNVICQSAQVRLSSSGNATLNVLEVLEADLSSSGNVYYIGNPRIVYKDSSSSGRVQPLP